MARPRRPVTPAERQQVADLHAAGQSRAAIAKELQRSPTTVGKIAAELGLVWDRAATVVATAAKTADLAARRAELAGLLLDDAFRIRTRFFAEYVIKQAVGSGEGVEVVTMRYDQPPAAELRNLITSVGIAVDKHLALVKADADTSGRAAVDAWLDAMTGRTGAP